MRVPRVRHVPREREEPAPLDAPSSDRRVAAEAMHDGAVDRTLIEHSKDLGPRVSDVKDERQSARRARGSIWARRARIWSSGGECMRKKSSPHSPTATTLGSVRSCSISDTVRGVHVARVVRVHPGGREHPADSDRASSRERRLVAGSIPTQTSVPTPASAACATTSPGSSSSRNRWQWVSTAVLCTAGSRFGSSTRRPGYAFARDPPPGLDAGRARTSTASEGFPHRVEPKSRRWVPRETRRREPSLRSRGEGTGPRPSRSSSRPRAHPTARRRGVAARRSDRRCRADPTGEPRPRA